MGTSHSGIGKGLMGDQKRRKYVLKSFQLLESPTRHNHLINTDSRSCWFSHCPPPPQASRSQAPPPGIWKSNEVSNLISPLMQPWLCLYCHWHTGFLSGCLLYKHAFTICKHSRNKRLWGRMRVQSDVPSQSLVYFEIFLSQKANQRLSFSHAHEVFWVTSHSMSYF